MTAPDREALGRAAHLAGFPDGSVEKSEVHWVWDNAMPEEEREAWRRTADAPYAAGRASRDEEVAALRAENERLEALFQRTHGCHSSWVAEGVRLRTEAERLTRERDDARTMLDLAEGENIALKERLEQAEKQSAELRGALGRAARILESAADALDTEGLDDFNESNGVREDISAFRRFAGVASPASAGSGS